MATSAHLTVRPREMATGTKNAQAGEQSLDSLPGYILYVPKNCVGTKRVPLVVLLGGAGHSARQMMNEQQGLADKFGVILLTPEAAAGEGSWDALNGIQSGETQFGDRQKISTKVVQFSGTDVKNIDAALKQVLRKFAIDPDKIALTGFSNGGSYSIFLGRSNTDVFSRVAPLSAVYPLVSASDPLSTRKIKFFVSGGVAEGWAGPTLLIAQELRNDGHDVEAVIGLRPHQDRIEDETFMWSWLMASWKTPDASASVIPRVAADSDPLLTVDAVAKMTKFWSRFVKEPDSVLVAGRREHQAPVALMIGKERVSLLKTNMVAMASKYPSVAEDLEAAGLTAKEHDALRIAITRVLFTRNAQGAGGPIADGSVLAKNIAFRVAHEAEFKALGETGISVTQ